MVDEQYSRTAMVLGEEGVKKLRYAKVILFGLGGVGSYTAEALARAGVGHLVLIDGDTVSVSNINRQLPALNSTVGRAKTDVVRERIYDIDPSIKVETINVFYNAENADRVDFSRVDYVADAIDTVASKILLIEKARNMDIPVISCMGAGNKLDPTRFEVADIEKTSVCPLAKRVRIELRKKGIRGVKAVFSKEEPVKLFANDKSETGKSIPGSLSFVPSVAGLIMAGEIIKDIAQG